MLGELLTAMGLRWSFVLGKEIVLGMVVPGVSKSSVVEECIKDGPGTSEEEKHILNACMSGRGCSLWVSFEQQGITKEVRKETSVISTVARQLLLIREHSEHKLPSPHSLGGYSSIFPWYKPVP